MLDQCLACIRHARPARGPCPGAAGDFRTGRQLLADAAADRRRTVDAMAACPRGRAELDTLAAAVEVLAGGPGGGPANGGGVGWGGAGGGTPGGSPGWAQTPPQSDCQRGGSLGWEEGSGPDHGGGGTGWEGEGRGPG